MREEERIKRICRKLEELWNRVPDERFYQLLINAGMMKDDNYFWHIEDDILEKHIDKLLKKKK